MSSASSPASSPQRRGRLPALGAVVAIVIGVAVALSSRSSGAGQSLETPDHSFAVTVPTSYGLRTSAAADNIAGAQDAATAESVVARAFDTPRGAQDSAVLTATRMAEQQITCTRRAGDFLGAEVIFQCPVKDPTGTAYVKVVVVLVHGDRSAQLLVTRRHTTDEADLEAVKATVATASWR